MIDNRGRGRERAERRDKSRMHVATQEGMDREEDCSCPPAADGYSKGKPGKLKTETVQLKKKRWASVKI